MDEAEIYGDGLERGRAVNLYVDNSEQMQANLITEGPRNLTVMINETAELPCTVHERATAWLWFKGFFFKLKTWSFTCHCQLVSFLEWNFFFQERLGLKTIMGLILDEKSINILSGRIRMLDGKLKIRNVTLDDSGWYTCEATDLGKKSNRASAFLKVLEPSKFFKWDIY